MGKLYLITGDIIENSKECNKKVIAECSYAKKILETEIESK